MERNLMSYKNVESDICKNYLNSDNTFTCKVTNKKYYITNYLDCNCMDVIY